MKTIADFVKEKRNEVKLSQEAFYFCLSLKLGKYFAYYLKEVLLFICISDA